MSPESWTRADLMIARSGLEWHRVGTALFITGFGLLAAFWPEPTVSSWLPYLLPGAFMGLIGSFVLLRARALRIPAALMVATGVGGLATMLLSLGANDLFFFAQSYVWFIASGVILLALVAQLVRRVPNARLKWHALALAILFITFVAVTAACIGLQQSSLGTAVFVACLFGPTLVYSLILGRMARAIELTEA
jgi:hypothetical protein